MTCLFNICKWSDGNGWCGLKQEYVLNNTGKAQFECPLLNEEVKEVE